MPGKRTGASASDMRAVVPGSSRNLTSPRHRRSRGARAGSLAPGARSVFISGMTLKIYTRTGDRGETGLFGGGRVEKDHVRVDAYGEVDELNSTLGLAIVHLEAAGEAELAAGLRQVQADLFTVGAVLAT